MMNLYATYDVFPSSKGSSTHIKEMISELARHGDEMRLLCLRGNDKLPAVQKDDPFLIKRYYAEEKLNYLEKATLFSEEIYLEVSRHQDDINIAHFRDIWSGMGILAHKHLKTVFEVNALMSIELPYRYPNLTDDFLKKLRALEQQCVDNVSVIITPSTTTKRFLVERYNTPENKIKVIPNGAYIPEGFKKPTDAPDNYIIYFGALQSWQGVDVLIKAMASLLDYDDLYLVICSSVKERVFKSLQKLMQKIGVADRIILKTQLRREELYNYIHYAKISIAPLKACDRNVVQGCSPLKILESMACGTTILASDLPVIKEIVSEEEAMFFEPDRELDLARCIRFLLDSPEKRRTLAKSALSKIQKEYTWQVQLEKLRDVYENLKTNHE